MSCGDRPMTAALLKRIAHTVDGIRTGEEIWLVIRDVDGYPVVMVTTGKVRAEERCEAENQEIDKRPGEEGAYFVCGPYSTQRDKVSKGEEPREEILPRLVILRHGPDTDPENGEEKSDVTDCIYLSQANFESFAKGRLKETDGVKILTKIVVSWHTELRNPTDGGLIDEARKRKGDSRTFAWKPAGDESPMVDSLFFTVAAADGILFPYLSHAHGHAFGRRQKEKVMGRLLDTKHIGAVS